MPPWIILTVAILSEVVATVALRWVDGFSRILPLVVVVAGYALSFWFLALALKHFELSLTYAVWAGAGTALIALIGVAMLGEPLSLLKAASLLMVIAGVVGLNLAASH